MIVTRISCARGENPLPAIDNQNWVPAEGVKASFDISHRGSSILLRYVVQEPQVIAVNKGFNSSVWEDSCLEFFISLEGDESYYNFEFNAIGTVLGAYGPDRNHRIWSPDDVLEQIQVNPTLGQDLIENLEGDIHWELDIVLPLQVFCHHEISDIAGKKARANFYKCGDKLKKPHFLSWSPVLTPEPNFHCPEFFDVLEFE